MSQTYLLNTPVLTDYGDWRFSGPLSVEQARTYLAADFVSAVGHAGAAAFLSRLLGLDVPFQRISVHLQVGDKALILRMKQRLPEGQIFTAEEIASLDFELGLLERLA